MSLLNKATGLMKMSRNAEDMADQERCVALYTTLDAQAPHRHGRERKKT